MISRSGRVPDQGPDWFLVATEAFGGGTPDLSSVLEVWRYIRGVGVENKSGESTRGPQGRRAHPRVWGRPPPLWRPRDSFGASPVLRGLLLVQKNRRKVSGHLDSV